MIEKIGSKEYELISVPCNEVVELVKRLKNKYNNVTIGEVGVGVGATSLAILKQLTENDSLYLFSYEDDVNELVSDLKNLNDKKVNIVGIGNTKRTYDSYSWNLAKLVLKMRSENTDGMFDLVYLDGAHTFIHDAPACCCIKELLKVGGYVVFDDMLWSQAKSPTNNPNKFPQIRERFTDEQIETCQVNLVVSLFMEKDDKFCKVSSLEYKDPNVSIWQRIM